jgi:hypothetical protein
MRKYRVEENGKVICEGVERRLYGNFIYPTDDKKVFGIFSTRDIAAGIIYIMSVVITITVFWYRTEYRIEALEKITRRIDERTEIIKICQQQSDNFHASIFEEQFDCGKPDSRIKKTVIKKITGEVQ